MKLNVLYESVKNHKNIMLLVHPHYIIEKYHAENPEYIKYLDLVLGKIQSKLSSGWIVIVSHMPLWGQEVLHKDKINVYNKFMKNIDSFKSNSNFYYVDDSKVFGVDTSKNKVGLCGDSKVIDLILNSENITVEIGGGYKSSCVKMTIDTLGGEDFLKELNIELINNDLLFDY